MEKNKKNNLISKKIKEAKLEITKKLEKIKEEKSNNFFDYVDYYGDNTFEDKEFNEIDNIIFSMISYIDFSDIVSYDDKNKIFELDFE